MGNARSTRYSPCNAPNLITFLVLLHASLVFIPWLIMLSYIAIGMQAEVLLTTAACIWRGGSVFAQAQYHTN